MTLSKSCDAGAFAVSSSDNVATLLAEVPAGGRVRVLGEAAHPLFLRARQAIPNAHKIALQSIAAGAPVLKFGHRIGHATQAIQPGDWVHLHNCASDVDERSGTLDLHTGAPEDTLQAYE